MIFREALVTDIQQIQVVRNSVNENRLSDPALVPDIDVEDYITRRGKGWVCEIDDKIAGFSIVSIADTNVWALFIDPHYEGRGIGKQLHEMMMNWYFTRTENDIWLGTAPGTRADRFYRKAGWRETGMQGNGEIRFEMTAEEWKSRDRLLF